MEEGRWDGLQILPRRADERRAGSAVGVKALQAATRAKATEARSELECMFECACMWNHRTSASRPSSSCIKSI